MSLCQERTVFDALLSFNVANGQIQVISSLAKVYRTFQNKKKTQYRFRLCLLLIDDNIYLFFWLDRPLLTSPFSLVTHIFFMIQIHLLYLWWHFLMSGMWFGLCTCSIKLKLFKAQFHCSFYTKIEFMTKSLEMRSNTVRKMSQWRIMWRLC